MERAPRGIRLHIGIFGKRNAGKSSLLNAITRQDVSIVSDTPGTTTDPVEKPMEILPLGPVQFIDTAGLDDTGSLGGLRAQKSRQVIDRADLAVIACDPRTRDRFEDELIAELTAKQVPVIIAFTKADIARPDPALVDKLRRDNLRVVETSVLTGLGIPDLIRTILEAAPDEFVNQPAIVADLVGPGELAVLVVPIDKEAPKGRLILPQVQTIRDLLDADAYCMVVKERELKDALARLNRPPKIVVTDSQAFLKVTADTPPGIPLTSFSILFARYKGDLVEMTRGTMAIDRLQPGDRVLISEACTHHPIADDIGRVKIPRWLEQYVGGKLEFTTVMGHDFPADLPDYKLVVHCGACMLNRREVLNRMLHCREAGVPVTNYGLTIAYSLGIFERALGPFPASIEAYRELKRRTA